MKQKILIFVILFFTNCSNNITNKQAESRIAICKKNNLSTKISSNIFGIIKVKCILIKGERYETSKR